jgi:hypothetical protein
VTTLLKKLVGAPAATATERDLLDTICDSAIPNPAALRERLAGLTQQIDAAEREWERLDRRGDAAAFLALTPIAERLQALRAEAADLPPQIERAERRRSAFLALARMHAAIAADTTARLQVLLEHPPSDAGERDKQLGELDRSTRLHSRVIAHLSRVSNSPLFHDPADALRVLRDDLEARIAEVNRWRVPGMRRPLEWPAAMTELIEVMEGRERRTA